MDTQLIYECPLNEHVRLFLKIEACFNQVEHYLQQTSYWDTRTAVDGLCDLITLLDRPELKTKLLQQLNQYKKLFSTPENATEPKATKALKKIEDHLNYLQNNMGKLTQDLDKIEFLANLRLRLGQAGGGGWNFDLPAYHFWLHQKHTVQKADLTKWVAQLTPAKNIVDLLLEFSRNSCEFSKVKINEGFYEQPLDPNTDYQLLRFSIAKEDGLFPEFSVGRHRFNLHLFQLTDNRKTEPFNKNLTAQIACCL